jgi:nicotinate-nucleotide adenylyltransferase
MTVPGQGSAAIARMGVFGGTFNPIHVGHLRAAEEVTEALGLERMLFVPSAAPPHKSDPAGDAVAPAEWRLAWARRAVQDNPRFQVDDLEVERGGPSYSVDTLRILAERLAPDRPVFVIGHDAFVELGTWKEPETILRLAHFAVTTRPPVARGQLADWLPRCLRDDVEVAPDGLSGRHRGAGTWVRIRRRLREGRSVRYLLPEVVRIAVLESRAYALR